MSLRSRIMKNLGINFERFIMDIEQSAQREHTAIILVKIPISSKYRRIIEISKEELPKTVVHRSSKKIQVNPLSITKSAIWNSKPPPSEECRMRRQKVRLYLQC